MSDLKMPDINDVRLAGRLTKDPELRYVTNGAALCKMGLAVTRKYKSRDGESKEDTLFINVTAWRGTAEYCGERLRKGRPVIVEGSLTMSEWEDKQTGQKRTAIEVTADRVQALDWDERSGGAPTYPGQVPPPPPPPPFEPKPQDDVPF